jgi:glutamine amidotransferase
VPHPKRAGRIASAFLTSGSGNSNSLSDIRGSLIPRELDGEYMYFVHSYYAPLSEYTGSVAGYINPFSASLEKGNFYATQFHPEKSGTAGEKILKRFLEL